MWHGTKVQGSRLTKTLILVAMPVWLAGCSGTSTLSSGAPDTTSALGDATSLAGKTQKATDAADHARRLAEATRYWGQQYQKQPENPQNAINYVLNLKASGQKATALQTLLSANRRHPDNKAIASELGRMLLSTGNIKRASKLLDQAYDASNPDWRVLSALGVIAARRGKLNEAEELLVQANQIQPDQPSILNNLAMVNALNKKPDIAETLLRRAMNKESSSKIRKNLSLVLKLQGRSEKDMAAKPDQLAGAMEVPRSETPKTVPALAKTAEVTSSARSSVAAKENPAHDLAPLDLAPTRSE